MKHQIHLILFSISLVFTFLTTAAANQTNHPVGLITLVIGQSYATDMKGHKRRLQQKDRIFVGDHIETGKGSHIHVKFIDEGRISVRPESRLYVESYIYDPLNPEKSSIRFYLQQGVLRSISGKATQAAHHRYRMNTPIAALGVLGTDYLLRTDDKTTWAAVYSGGIALAPISAGCSQSGLGICNNATKLTADMGDMYLQVSLGDTRSQRKSHHNIKDHLQKGTIIPKQSSKNKTSHNKTNLTPIITKQDLTSTDGQWTDKTVNSQNNDLANNEKLGVAPLSTTPAKLAWGRWYSEVAHSQDQLSQSHDQAKNGREFTGVGNIYGGLFRAPSDLLSLQPQTGVFNFNLQRSHVVYIEKGARWQDSPTAQLNKADLKVDFGQRKFTTQLEMSHQNTGHVTLNVTGDISNQGILEGSNIANHKIIDSVAGALTLDGTKAGLQFEKKLDQGTFRGISEWHQ